MDPGQISVEFFQEPRGHDGPAGAAAASAYICYTYPIVVAAELIFDWDKANVEHIAIHSVTPEEAVQVLRNDPLELDFQDVDGEERILVVGMTCRGRCLVVAWTLRRGAIRVATA